jgi:hypothetical protein
VTPIIATKQQSESNNWKAESRKRKEESGKRKAESGKQKAESNKASKLGKRWPSERVNKQNETQRNKGIKSGLAIVARKTMDFNIYKKRLLSNVSSCKARKQLQKRIPRTGWWGAGMRQGMGRHLYVMTDVELWQRY